METEERVVLRNLIVIKHDPEISRDAEMEELCRTLPFPAIQTFAKVLYLIPHLKHGALHFDNSNLKVDSISTIRNPSASNVFFFSPPFL